MKKEEEEEEKDARRRNDGTCACMCRMCARVRDTPRKSGGYKNPTWFASRGRGLSPRTIKPLQLHFHQTFARRSVTHLLSPCGCLSSQVSAIHVTFSREKGTIFSIGCFGLKECLRPNPHPRRGSSSSYSSTYFPV